MISRDIGPAPTPAARTGAPDAVQVADRFRLWQNLTKAVERCGAAHRSCLADPDPEPAAGQEVGPPPERAARWCCGLPDAAGRYYVLQFVDAWTSNFACVGR